MFKLRFGIIWTFITTACFALVLFVPGEARGGDDMSVGMFLFFLLFEVIGIKMIRSGAKIVIADKNTEKYGNIVFGRILDISETGSYSNEKAELKATILAYIPEEGGTRTFSEMIGYSTNGYHQGSFLLLKHFEDDVNIIQELQESSVPANALEKLKEQTNYFDSDDTNKSEINDYNWKRIN